MSVASCLECGKWIKPQRWACEKCEEKAISVYEKSVKDEKK